mgnify:CR=1 FL=1
MLLEAKIIRISKLISFRLKRQHAKKLIKLASTIVSSLTSCSYSTSIYGKNTCVVDTKLYAN